MNVKHTHYDAVVIGSGPAGQNAAMAAADHGARVLIVEREREVGGACVQYGTIPSKTLRETAVTLSFFKRRSGDVFDISQREDLRIDSLMTRLHQVVEAHQATTARNLEFAGVERVHGMAEFVSSHELRIRGNRGHEVTVRAKNVFIATGSRPRNPPEMPVDHENILDSDSILSMTYLPQSLTVFGGGVIASEYAATFASLGVQVVMIDRYPSPMGFLDAEIVAGFVKQYESNGGSFRGNCRVRSVEWDGISKVLTTLDTGEVIESDKALVALGRCANTDSLGVEAAGLTLTDRGLIQVDANYRTEVASIYAIGDAIGPPALASSSMEQGRRAATHALDGDLANSFCGLSPMGIYTIPEIASVGLTEKEATEKHGKVIVGRVPLTELARGQIMAASGGLLKLISDPEGRQILGVQIVGDGATEIIHVGQMAMLSMNIDQLASVILNFPTLAEAYRTAAQEVIRARRATPDPPVNSNAAVALSHCVDSSPAVPTAT